MSEFRWGVIIAGALVIAAVYLYGLFQERRARKNTEASFDDRRGDALLDSSALMNARPTGMDQRVEPSFGNTAIDDSDFEAREADVRPKQKFDFSPDAPLTREPSTVPVTTGSLHAADHRSPDNVPLTTGAALAVANPAILNPALLNPVLLNIDPKIDLVAVVMASDAVAPSVLMEAIGQSRNFGKPVFWEGLQNGAWSPVQTDVPRYKEIKIGLQLGDRKGPLDEAFIGQFSQLAQHFAAEAHGVCQIEAPEISKRRALELDQFAVSVDVEIGVNVVSRSGVAFQGTKVRALAEAAGLKLDPHSGVFQSTNERGEPQFVLANLEPRAFMPEQMKNLTTQGLTILLDVPRVADGIKAFPHMMALARNLADNLGGEVVDDARKPLSNAGAEAIRMQLAEIYRRMAERGIQPGSLLAQRLFS